MARNIVLLVLLSTVPAIGQTARSYHNELYKAGGLDRFADAYACFPDQDNGAFFIFGKSDALRSTLIEGGAYKKLPKSERDSLDKGFIFLRPYYKGIARERLSLNKDGDSYLFKGDYKGEKGAVLKIRYTFNWSTLRYEHSVGLYRNGVLSPKDEATMYGRCEEVPAGVPQKGE